MLKLAFPSPIYLSTMKALEESVRYVQSLEQKHQNDCSENFTKLKGKQLCWRLLEKNFTKKRRIPLKTFLISAAYIIFEL